LVALGPRTSRGKLSGLSRRDVPTGYHRRLTRTPSEGAKSDSRSSPDFDLSHRAWPPVPSIRAPSVARRRHLPESANRPGIGGPLPGVDAGGDDEIRSEGSHGGEEGVGPGSCARTARSQPGQARLDTGSSVQVDAVGAFGRRRDNTPHGLLRAKGLGGSDQPPEAYPTRKNLEEHPGAEPDCGDLSRSPGRRSHCPPPQASRKLGGGLPMTVTRATTRSQ
jgi:hypothetical protein